MYVSILIISWPFIGIFALTFVYLGFGSMQRLRFFLTGATAKAEALLITHLSEEQKETLSTRGYINVCGEDSGLTYSIAKRSWVFVRRNDGIRWCLIVRAPTKGLLPWPDEMLTKKLLIESDERMFVWTARKYY